MSHPSKTSCRDLPPAEVFADDRDDTLSRRVDFERLRRENAELREALERAEGELRRQDDFLAVVAHELRNPITPLVFSIGVLLTKAKTGALPDERMLLRHLSVLARQVGRLKGDLNRLLDFSRIRSGRLELEAQRVDLVALVNDALLEMEDDLARARCPVRVSAPEAMTGCWDPLRVRQIVWNLLSNAAKYAPGAPVDVVISGDASTAELRVTDRGPGIAERDRDRIFRRFERAGARETHTGFGVGLWLVQQIVDALGGAVSVESEIGVGSTFMIRLPRRKDDG